jgi:hypothetical protein
MLGRETDVSTAFMIKNTTGVSLTDNITSFTSEGIHFSGVCKTGDNGVRFNSLYHHDYGLTYDADASTDEQNNGPNSNGNVWVSDWEPNSGYIGARHFGDKLQVGLSTYRVPSSPSTQNPTSFALMPGVSPVDWFPLGVAFWDDYNCPEGNLAPDTIIRKITTLDRKIATQQLGLPDTTPEGYLWLMEDYLYRKVKDNPGIANNETAVTNFVSAKQSQPIGQLYEVKQGIEHLYESSNSANAAIIDTITKAIHLCIVDIARIDSILLDTTLSPTLRENKISYRIDKLTNFQLLQDSLDHLMAIRNQGTSGVVSNLLSQNNAIISLKPWEQNQRFVNQLLLEKVIPDIDVTSSELAQLFNIAKLCPKYGGWAVYDARSIYHWITGIKVEESSCIPDTERSLKQNALNDHSVIFFPNPASDLVTLDVPELIPGTKLFLMNLTGQIVMETEVTANRTIFSVSRLNSGIYFTQIVAPGGHNTIGKLLINR